VTDPPYDLRPRDDDPDRDTGIGSDTGLTSSEGFEPSSGLSPRMRTFVALAAVAALGDVDAFEKEMHQAVSVNVTPKEILDALVELADQGIPVPGPIFDLVRARIA